MTECKTHVMGLPDCDSPAGAMCMSEEAADSEYVYHVDVHVCGLVVNL